MSFYTVTLVAFFTSLSFGATTCIKPQGALRLTAVGDVLVHRAPFEDSIQSEHRFKNLWRDLVPTLSSADLTVGNLEGPVAPGVVLGGKPYPDPGFVYDSRVYSGTNFVFNFHPYVLDDLKSSGFDILSTANNHSLDRSVLGVDKTLHEIRRRGLYAVGTRKSSSGDSFTQVFSKNNFHFGLVACTEMTNGMKDKFSQVLRCDDPVVVTEIQRLKKVSEAVIVFPHWGDEYQLRPNNKQKNWARKWVAAGALLIVGNHPHVLQTVEWIESADHKKSLVIYSLGNFIAYQGGIEKQTSALAHIDFLKKEGAVEIGQFSYTPIHRPDDSLSSTYVTEKSDSGRFRFIKKQLGPAHCL